MKYGIRWLVWISLCMFASLAGAGTVGGPATGLWYNAQETGRGFNIDLQGDTMIVTTFIYETSGDPIWYLSSGIYNHDTGVFTSSYDSYSNGQCFGCPAGAPDVQSGAAGPITITFHTNQTATLTYTGGSVEIVKYNYGFTSKTAMLYGEWALSYETGGVVSGDWLVFDTPFTDSTGAVYASGHAAGNAAITALGIYDTASSEVHVIVTQGTTSRVYRFGVFDDHRAIGVANTVVQGQPASAAMAATGARLLYKSEIAGGIIGAAATGPIVSMPAAQSSQQSLANDDAAFTTQLQNALAELQASRK